MATQDEENNQGVSMVDILNEEKQLESDANAVLGGSDDKNCTYDQGYVGRQALYSCLTCCNEREMAGVCLACSLHCHEGHQLIELYTKRHFRCDCGNTKFPNMTCRLYSEKDDVNKKNRYNQNFLGLYCTCSRPYPNPDDDVEDEMIQCTICEDWFHSRHLGTTTDQDFHEMVCSDCMKKCDFLWAYLPHSQETSIVKKESTEENVQVDVLETESTTGEPESKADPIEETSKGEKGSSEFLCLLEQSLSTNPPHREGSAYWPDGWRNKLCRCPSCIELYSTLDVGFIIDATDTVQHYEDKGQAKANSSQYDTGIQALSSMDRVQLGEMIHGYNHLKDSLTEYLKKFAENKKVVREEDIREFFGQMEAKKKRRLDGM